MLQFSLVGQEEQGGGVAHVVHEEHPAGELVTAVQVEHAQAVHHGHLDGGVLVHVEVLLGGLLGLEGLLPFAWRGVKVTSAGVRKVWVRVGE